MKEKLMSKIILIILVLSTILSFYEVKAFTGEIDPNGYLTFPMYIKISNGVAKGTVSLSSRATGYNIAYQKVDMDESTYNNIIAKNKEINDYITNVNNTLKEKKEELDKLQEAYKELSESEPKNQEAITEALNNYNTKYNESKQYSDTEKANIEQKKKDFYEMLPEYTDNWTETTNSTDNVQIDVSGYTANEKIFFILWVKISDGSNTYYDFNTYSTEITNKDNSDDDDEVDNGEWTNFSKAKFELVKEGVADAAVEISNVTPKEGSKYYLFINNNNQKPNITGNIIDILNNDDRITLEYNEDTKKFRTLEHKIAVNVELNQELYATVVESNSENNLNVVSYGNKLSRYEESKYSDAFHATFMTSEADQIITNFTHSQENNRQIQIKIGKINDSSILQKIKGQNIQGFSDLLNYAKSNNGLYDQILDAVKDDAYAIEYDTDYESKVISLNGLQNDGYYYLYVKTLDENGKYVSNEAVTLAQANVHEDGSWAMFFYGSADFKWADFGNIIDDTVANGKIPQTGANTLGLALCGALIISIGAFSYISYKKNKF